MSMNDRDANPLSVKYYNFRFEEIRELSGSEFFTECGYLKICGPKFKDFEVTIHTEILIVTMVTASLVQGWVARCQATVDKGLGYQLLDPEQLTTVLPFLR